MNVSARQAEYSAGQNSSTSARVGALYVGTVGVSGGGAGAGVGAGVGAGAGAGADGSGVGAAAATRSAGAGGSEAPPQLNATYSSQS